MEITCEDYLSTQTQLHPFIYINTIVQEGLSEMDVSVCKDMPFQHKGSPLYVLILSLQNKISSLSIVDKVKKEVIIFEVSACSVSFVTNIDSAHADKVDQYTWCLALCKSVLISSYIVLSMMILG